MIVNTKKKKKKKKHLLFVACGLFYEAIVLCLTLCYFVLVFFSPFSIAITSLGEKKANLSACRTFVRFGLVWFCLFPLPLGVWEGLRFVIVALSGLFSYFFFNGSTIFETMGLLDKDTSSHCGFIIALGQEAKGDNLRISLPYSIT